MEIEQIKALIDVQDRGWSTPCWIWTGRVARGKYVHPLHVHYQGQKIRPKKALYELEHGPVPEGKQLNHLCDIATCVRPLHLYVGTQLENMQDRDCTTWTGAKPGGLKNYVEEIRRRAAAGESGFSIWQTSFQGICSEMSIHNIISRRHYKYLMSEEPSALLHPMTT